MAQNPNAKNEQAKTNPEKAVNSPANNALQPKANPKPTLQTKNVAPKPTVTAPKTNVNTQPTVKHNNQVKSALDPKIENEVVTSMPKVANATEKDNVQVKVPLAPPGKKELGSSYNIEEHNPDVKKVMADESNFLTETEFSNENITDKTWQDEKAPRQNVDTKREFIEEEEARTFNIDTKKYKLWSLINVSKHNKFLPIILPIINNDLVIPNNLGKYEIEELKNILEFKFAILFREYIKDSKVAKLKLEARFDELIRKNEKAYNEVRTKIEYNHNSKQEVFEKGLETIDEELKLLNEKLKVVNKNVQGEISLTKKKKNILRLINDKDRKQVNSIDTPVKQAHGEQVLSWQEEIDKITKKIAVLSAKKDKIIERINKEKLHFTNELDREFIEKQKIKTRIEVDKIEILIFLRENLVALNRTIRDIKIQIGIKNIQQNNQKSEQIFDDIAEALNRTKKQFELLDDIGSANNKIKVEQSIDVSSRIVDLKTSENY